MGTNPLAPQHVASNCTSLISWVRTPKTKTKAKMKIKTKNKGKEEELVRSFHETSSSSSQRTRKIVRRGEGSYRAARQEAEDRYVQEEVILRPETCRSKSALFLPAPKSCVTSPSKQRWKLIRPAGTSALIDQRCEPPAAATPSSSSGPGKSATRKPQTEDSDVYHVYCTIPDLPPPSTKGDGEYCLLQKH